MAALLAEEPGLRALLRVLAGEAPALLAAADGNWAGLLLGRALYGLCAPAALRRPREAGGGGAGRAAARRGVVPRRGRENQAQGAGVPVGPGGGRA